MSLAPLTRLLAVSFLILACSALGQERPPVELVRPTPRGETTPASNLSVEYDENHLAIFDVAANRATSFSAFDASASSYVFANLQLIVQGDPLYSSDPGYDFEDAVAVLWDRGAGLVVVYRLVDERILTCCSI